jgi:chromosome segregation ATPase
MNNELTEMLTAIIREELSPVVKRLDTIENRFDTMDTRLDSIETRLDTMDTRLETIETRLDRMDTQLDTIETRLDTMDTRLDKAETRLERIEDEQQQIKQAVLETNATVKRIVVIQDQQHRIIELLSARSIEQEAMLKRII